MESELHSWKQKGVISLWRYTENPKAFGGWHLSANDAGIESLLELLRVLQSAPGSHRTITITQPSTRLLQVPNFQQGRAKWVAPSKLQLQVSPDALAWDFPEGLEPAQFTVGTSYLPALIHGLEGIPRGEGDYAIGSSVRGKLRLCFWWWLDAA
ncbi:hypothetical protein [Lysobacter niastensis]|nr:hypothetical protein [Lysobacter niastensis]